MENRTIILRLIAGGYVFYLGMQLITGFINGSSAANPVISLGGGAIFLIFGALCVISAIRGFMKNTSEVPEETEDAQDNSEETDDAEDEEE